MTEATRDAAWLTRRLKRREETATARSERGDHDLNPDARPAGALKPAAVLVPVVTRADALTVVLTRRTEHLAHHPGQISFPGGHIDAVDASPEAAALREADEEIGLPAHQVELIGRLDTYVTRTGFDVTPIVGLVDPAFTARPDPHEVAEVFEVPLGFFLDPTNHERHTRLVGGVERYFYAMPYGDYFIWGATAGMLVNLYQRLADDV
jgi:8-oxo-dGTP pyrophosphatase MutT (NUDIX family)